MPAPRKIDLLPPELRQWLQDALNWRLETEGLELKISRSALHAYGQEFKAYAQLQEQAQGEIRAFLEEASLQSEVDVTRALFQQLTTIQWRLQMAMISPNDMPDARGLKDLTTALNNLIRSTSLRDAIVKAERAAQAERLDAAVSAGDIDAAAAQKARAIMGFA